MNDATPVTGPVLEAAPGEAAGLRGRIARAVEALRSRLDAALARGGPASLVLDLGAAAMPAAPLLAEGVCWLDPTEEDAMLGSGPAIRLAGLDAAGAEAWRDGWQVIGADRAGGPVAFWTAPPPPGPARFDLEVPRVLLRWHGGRLTAVLSAAGDGTPAGELLGGWRADVAALLDPGAQAGWRAPGPRFLGRSLSPDREEWIARVRRTTAAIAAGRFSKAVLARSLTLDLSAPAEPGALAARLARLHRGCCIFALPHAGGHVVAASPERLAVRRGERLTSHALAGTAPRHEDPARDAAARAALVACPKERREHALVADAIAAGLAALCTGVERPDAPSVMRLAQVQHLWTPVRGRLRPGVGLLGVVARLHPTPAVLGWPSAAAADWLRDLGERRDGLYSGVAGWLDGTGDGDAVMVLRSAHVAGRRARLWAGAGIVGASEPEREWTETELKLSTMLSLFEAA